jgi:hypothetical protein
MARIIVSQASVVSSINNVVTLKTVNARHTVAVTGTAQGLCKYEIAKAFKDIDKYNEEVLKSSNIYVTGEDALPPISEMTFVIIKTANGIDAYSLNWINSSDYIIVSNSTDVRLLLKNVTEANINEALNKLADIGISARVI